MDSLTQITLGAAVSVAVMGRRTAVWKAALWGGIAGTLPDLDVVIDHGNAVLNMVRHRAESHSFFYLTLFAPLLAWLVSRIHDERPLFKTWWLALWLVLITHPLLDTMTVYGTQLLMPFSDHPFGVGSVFIIDPAYTVPLIVGLVAALRLKNAPRPALERGDAGAHHGLPGLERHGPATRRPHRPRVAGLGGHRRARPAGHAGALQHRALAPGGNHARAVLRGLLLLLDAQPTVRWTAYPRGAELMAQHGDNDSVQHIAAFSQGFFSLQATDGRLMLTDLRMGQEPAYVFRFDVGALNAVGAEPPVQLAMRPDIGRGLPWLWDRIRGVDAPMPVAKKPEADLAAQR